MVVLALETATRAGSVALLAGEMCRARLGDAAVTHGERLPDELSALLGEAGLAFADVERLAVIAGPGSFTGLRVGVAAMQGLALVSGRLVIPVPTLDAMAEAWRLEHPNATPTVVVPCLDGQRGEVFFGAWLIQGDEPIEHARQLVPVQVGRPETLQVALLALARDASHAIVLIGDGARRHLDHFAGGPARVELEEGAVTLAESAARIAARRPDLAVAPHALRPVYIRRPDAELARERAASAASTAFTIVRASPSDDLSPVEALQRRAFASAWGPEAIRWELTHNDVARLYVLSDAGGALVAYCACWLLVDELHINSLAVDDAWRRQGLARRLLARVFEESVAAGARSATLEVRQSNRAARALYEGLGFRVEAVRRDYYQEPREDALILWHRRLADRGAKAVEVE